MDENLTGSSNEDNSAAEETNSSSSSTDNDYDDNAIVLYDDNVDSDLLVLPDMYSHQQQQQTDVDDANGNGDSDRPMFDKVLPSSHSYLGQEMEERRGRTIWEEDSCQTVLVLPPPPIVVIVPGQVLPLSVVDFYTIRLLEHCITQRGGVFGVLVKWPERYGQLNDPDFVGTTAEIYEFHKRENSNGQTRRLTIKAKARQRFKALHLDKSQNGFYFEAKIRILPEVVLPDTFHHICPHINRYASSKSDRFRKRGAITTRWPLWVYDQYHLPKLVTRVENELEYLKRGRDFELPKNPTALSFWVAQNLPARQRMTTLKLNSPIQRLRWELCVLEKCQIFLCGDCLTQVGEQRDVIAMSVEGPQGTYVNPHGYLHETLTLSRVSHITLIGRPSNEYSWFPGYAWIPAYCANCRAHMGWKFVAERDNLQPAKFWGLSRRSLKMKIDLPQSREECMPHVM